MKIEEYEKLIPHACSLRTAQAHYEVLMWCWSITAGLMKCRAVEGPQRCHGCEISSMSQRLEKFIKKCRMEGHVSGDSHEKETPHK